MNITPPRIDELRVNLLGKLLFAAVGAWLVGKAVNMKIRGTKNEVLTVVNAMIASRRLNEVLNSEDTSFLEIIDALSKKHKTAKDFEREFNVPWPL